MDYGNGSIRQRRKAAKNAWVWELRVNLGSDPTTGKRRQASRMFTGTKTAAADALRQLRTERAEQRGEVHTMATLFEDWIEKVLVPTCRPGTVTGARSAVSAVLKPALGHLGVETLKSGDLDTFYTDQRKAGSPERSGAITRRSVRPFRSPPTGDGVPTIRLGRHTLRHPNRPGCDRRVRTTSNV